LSSQGLTPSQPLANGPVVVATHGLLPHMPCEACPKPRDAYRRGWHIVRFVLRGGRVASTLPRAQSWSVLWSLLRAFPASVLHDYRDEGMFLLSCDDCLERRRQCVTAPHRRMSNPVNSFVFAVTVSLPKAKYLTAPHADSGVTLDEQIVDPQLSKTLSSSLHCAYVLQTGESVQLERAIGLSHMGESLNSE